MRSHLAAALFGASVLATVALVPGAAHAEPSCADAPATSYMRLEVRSTGSVVDSRCPGRTLAVDNSGGFIDIAAQPLAAAGTPVTVRAINGDGSDHGWANFRPGPDGFALSVPADTQRLEVRWWGADATTNATAIEYGLIAALIGVAV